MARHAASKSLRHDLLRAGLTVTAAGAMLAAGAAGAQAAQALPVPGADQALGGAGNLPGSVITGTLTQATASGFGPMKSMPLNPLAGTEANPLDNTVGTQVADFKPVDTGVLTGPLADGGAVKDLPVAGLVTSVLPG